MKSLQTMLREVLHGPQDEQPAPEPAVKPSEPVAWADLRRGATILEARSGRLHKYGALFAAFAGALAVLVLSITGYTALIDEPGYIDKLKIPSHIQNAYLATLEAAASVSSTAVNSGRGLSQGVASLSNVSDSIADLADSVLFRILAGVMIMIGILSAVIRQSLSSMVAGVGGGVMLFSMPAVISSILADPSQPFVEAEVAAAPKSLDSMRFTELHTALAKVESISSSDRAYVLAQASIIEDLRATQIVAQAAAYIRSDGLSFPVPASYAYAIEMAADGELKTKAARSLESAYLEKVQSAKDVATAVSWPTTLLAFIAGCFLSFSLYLRRRVSRVRQLIGLLHEPEPGVERRG